MKKFVLIALFAASISMAQAPSTIPYHKISATNAFSVIAPASPRLLEKMLWINDNWHTNIDKALRYWTYTEHTNFEAGLPELYLSVTSPVLPGTNIIGATYADSNKTWTVDSVGGRDVLDFMTLYGTTNAYDRGWQWTNASSPQTYEYLEWSNAVSARGLMYMSNGVVTITATNALALFTAGFGGRFWTSNAASIRARISTSDGHKYLIAMQDQTQDYSEPASRDYFCANGLVMSPARPTQISYTAEAVLLGYSTDHPTRKTVGIKWGTWTILLLRTP